MSSEVLKVDDLTCGYGDRPVLKGLSFSVEDGELLGVIGPNGSGKTTLVRALTKILEPMDGRILLEGRDIKEMDLSELARRIAVVSQNPEGGSWMTVEEFVLLGRVPHRRKFQLLETKHDEEVAERAMALTGTLGLKGRLLKELSGGERQLISIAKALCQEPKLLLLDEPTAHLDIAHQVRVLDLIKKLNRDDGLTAITVLHDLNLAGEYCDRLLLLKDGKLCRTGLPEEVLDPRVIEDAYGVKVVVGRNPASSKPYVFPIPNAK